MQNTKIQELTDKLYQEGLSKGQQEAARLQAEAEAKAARIIADAQADAEAIRSKAEKAAAAAEANAEKEIQMACRQAVNTVRQQIEQLVTFRAVSQPVKSAFNDPAFLQDLFKTAVAAFHPDGGKPSLSALLPEAARDAFDNWLKNNVNQALAEELDVKFDGGIRSGFKLGPADGGYHIRFTEQDFEALVKAYLRPKMVELLFGQGE